MSHPTHLARIASAFACALITLTALAADYPAPREGELAEVLQSAPRLAN